MKAHKMKRVHPGRRRPSNPFNLERPFLCTFTLCSKRARTPPLTVAGTTKNEEHRRSNMKPNRIKALLSLLFIVLWGQLASAFYDPAVQRWINRDPILEEGGANQSGFVL